MLIIAVVLYDTKTILLPSFLISCQTPPKNNNNIITTIHFNFVSFFNIKVLYTNLNSWAVLKKLTTCTCPSVSL